ncbi:hypothetical protein QGX21_gp108 [Pseudomonas phage phiPsa315]|uniref:Uncharacterized protein n=1 Tax=Pseudomonas phage phiPsa315 TaxID=1460363 RepID=A0A7G9V206_9CAUD|nr:hypothetical protein QGX21_gp108 [Pseudomonas phage phiPsa315]QNO00312.1 hypothetical protein phiPsa315_118 [Pseudomonas phage phiPsa315]
MWPFKKRTVDPVLPQTEWEAVKPTDAIIFAVSTGEYSLWLFPYQYMNWAAEYMGKPKIYNVTSPYSFGAAHMMVEACKKYVQDVIRHE